MMAIQRSNDQGRVNNAVGSWTYLWARAMTPIVLVGALLVSCKSVSPAHSAADSSESSMSSVNAADAARGSKTMCELMHLTPCTETQHGPSLIHVSGRSGIVESRITETRDGKGRSSYLIIDQWREVTVDDQGQKIQVEKGCSILASGPSATGFAIPGHPQSAYFAPHDRVRQDPRFKIETMCPNP